MKPAYKPVLCVVSSHPIKGASGVPTGFPGRADSSAESTGRCRNKNNNSQYSRGQPPVDGFDLSDPVNAWYWNETDFQQRLATTPALSELKGADYSAVFFAGGHGTMWDFRDNQDAQRIIREVYESDGIVSAVCHGPAALVDAKLSSGEYLIKGKMWRPLPTRKRKKFTQQMWFPSCLKPHFASMVRFIMKLQTGLKTWLPTIALSRGRIPLQHMGLVWRC